MKNNILGPVKDFLQAEGGFINFYGGNNCGKIGKQNRCAQCGGSGKIETEISKTDYERIIRIKVCSLCRGLGVETEECLRCVGKGEILSKKKEFTGRIIKKECTKCDGTGQTECPRCHNGIIKCHICDGGGCITEKEFQEIKQCISCPVCNGIGRIPKYRNN